ncbi:MAG: hypothetical protein AB8G23_05575 [Myxococcota bacterium]
MKREISFDTKSEWGSRERTLEQLALSPSLDYRRVEKARAPSGLSVRSVFGFIASFVFCCTLASTAQAQLHVDIAVQENASDGRLSVHAYDFDTLPQFAIIVDKRAFVRGVGLSGNSLLLEDPGFVSRVSATELDPVDLAEPAGGEGLLFNVLSPPLSTMPSLGGRTVSFWDGSSAVTWGPTPDADEGIEIIKGSFFNPDDFLVVAGGTSDLFGFSLGAASGGGSLHEHMKLLLLPDNGALPPSGPDDGVYLMLLEVSYPSYAEWIPVFLGIEAFAGGLSTQSAAETAITSQLLNPLCSDGIDNDKDGLIDGADSGCVDGNDMSEREAASVSECDNGIDDDGDGLVDFHDLNGDGASDMNGDPDCLSAGQLLEAPEPGMGVGLLVGLSGLAGFARRRGRDKRRYKQLC